MTNEEKAREIAEKNAIIYDAEEDIANGLIYPTIHSTEECRKSAFDMAEWKDEQYKKEFNVPDYKTSFEDIVNHIGNDVYAKGYNKAREYYLGRFKEYLVNKREEIVKTLEDITEEDPRYFPFYERYSFLDIIIDEFFTEE